MLLTHLKKRRKEEGSSRLTVHLILPNSDDANPPIRVYIYLSFEWQPQNLIVRTSVCKFLFSLPPLSLHNARLECNAVCYSTIQHCCSRQHTHTLDTAVSLFRHHRRLFCPRYQKSVVFFFILFLFFRFFIHKPFNLACLDVYKCIYIFFPPFLFLLLLGLLLGLKGRVKTEAPNVPDREPIQRERGRTRCNKHNNNDPTVENIDFDEIR